MHINLGQDVFYVMKVFGDGEGLGHHDVYLAAKVVHVNEDDSVNLCVFNDELEYGQSKTTFFLANVKEGDGFTPRTWSADHPKH